jgi:hypothetical protein
VQIRAGIPIRIRHPQVGELTVRCEKLAIGGTDSLTLAVHHAGSGTSDEEKLALLASLTSGAGGLRPATERQPDRRA